MQPNDSKYINNAYSFKIKLQNLFDGDITIPHTVDYVSKIFCRKVFNYAYEVTQ